MGRPTKYDEARAAKILTALKTGASRKAASSQGGIDYRTFARWMEGNVTFATNVEVSENEAELRFTAVITKAASEGDWRAAESWLKRRRRDEWGDNVRVDVDDEITRLMALLAAGSKNQAS